MARTLKSTTIDGTIVRYIDAGDPASPEVLVLVHAFPMGTAMWEPQLDAFPGWRVIAPALPGFDGSGTPGPRKDPPSASDIDGYADQVIALLEALHIRRPVIGGLSMGGYVIFGIIRRAPDAASALILADTRTTPDSGERLAARHRTIEIARSAGPRGIANDMLPKLVSARTRERKPEVVTELRRLIEAQSGETIAEATRVMMTRPESTALLRGVRVPVLIIVGEDDVITTVADAEQMRSQLADVTVVRIPGAGHMSNLEDPAAFNEAVGEFLGRFGGP